MKLISPGIHPPKPDVDKVKLAIYESIGNAILHCEKCGCAMQLDNPKDIKDHLTSEFQGLWLFGRESRSAFLFYNNCLECGNIIRHRLVGFGPWHRHVSTGY